jgi:hypothetical protein
MRPTALLPLLLAPASLAANVLDQRDSLADDETTWFIAGDHGPIYISPEEASS